MGDFFLPIWSHKSWHKSGIGLQIKIFLKVLFMGVPGRHIDKIVNIWWIIPLSSDVGIRSPHYKCLNSYNHDSLLLMLLISYKFTKIILLSGFPTKSCGWSSTRKNFGVKSRSLSGTFMVRNLVYFYITVSLHIILFPNALLRSRTLTTLLGTPGSRS